MLHDAIAGFSALPAQGLRLIEHGILKQGMWADVLAFNPATICEKRRFEYPNQISEGMAFVPASRVPAIAGGEMTGALPGKVLRGPGCVP